MRGRGSEENFMAERKKPLAQQQNCSKFIKGSDPEVKKRGRDQCQSHCWTHINSEDLPYRTPQLQNCPFPTSSLPLN